MDDVARILIVDDDRDGCASLYDVLSDFGYEVDVAYNGAEALQRIDQKCYDIALLDYRMPDIDGVSLYERIKQQHPATAGIVITAFANEETHRSAEAAGADQILAKPVEMERLLASITRLSQMPVILLVDDDREFCSSMTDLLQEQGFRVSQAHCKTVAEARLALDRCRTAVIDLQLGRESGLELLEFIRNQYAGLNLIVISGYREQLQAKHQKMRDLGVRHVFAKPLDVKDFMQKLC